MVFLIEKYVAVIELEEFEEWKCERDAEKSMNEKYGYLTNSIIEIVSSAYRIWNGDWAGKKIFHRFMHVSNDREQEKSFNVDVIWENFVH